MELPSSTPSRMPSDALHSAPGLDAKPTLRIMFETEENPLLRFAFGLVGRREVAEDLVQEAFLRVHKEWGSIENPRPWLYRCVRNLALNHLRDHKREVLGDPAVEPADESRPDVDLERLEAVGMVRMLMAELTPPDRALLVFKYQDRCSYSEISKRTGLSIGNVGYRLHHLLKNLEETLRRAGVGGSKG